MSNFSDWHWHEIGSPLILPVFFICLVVVVGWLFKWMINRLALAFLSTRPVAHQLFPPLQWWRFGKRGQRRGSNVTIYHYRRQAVDLFPQFFSPFFGLPREKSRLVVLESLYPAARINFNKDGLLNCVPLYQTRWRYTVRCGKKQTEEG